VKLTTLLQGISLLLDLPIFRKQLDVSGDPSASPNRNAQSPFARVTTDTGLIRKVLDLSQDVG